jgi:hypothetical protein
MDVQSTFNSISQTFIFQELQSCTGTLDQFFPFVRWFYAHPFPLYLSKAFRHGDFTIISFEFHTQLGNLLRRVLFAPVHLRVFHPIAIGHLTCIFLLSVNDTHIIGLVSDALLIFLQLQEEFEAFRFSV